MRANSDKDQHFSRRQFIRVAATLLGGASLYAVLAPVQKSGLLDVASGAETSRPDARKRYWGFIVDATRCIGCGRCVLACKLENNVPFIDYCNRTWVERYVVHGDGEWVVDSPNSGINGFVAASRSGKADGNSSRPSAQEGTGEDADSAGAEDSSIRKAFFVPKLCNQCDNPPCVQVCPVGATYMTEDRIVLIDQKRCIGCGYCIEACPYGARYLVPDGTERTPTGEHGVADKCTWCYHRITKGRQPACVEVCPVGARICGDMNDPESKVSHILREQRVGVLKPDLGTEPKAFYIGLEGGVR